MNFPRIAARAFNTPLLVEPMKAGAFLRGMGPRLLGAKPRPGAFFYDDEDDDEPRDALPAFASLIGGELGERLRRDGGGYGLVDGVAIVPISGVLIHRGAWIGQSSGQMTYEGLWAQLEAAADNPMVKAVALEIDSFGGEVAGCFDTAELIRRIGAEKPVRAFVAEHAYSAAYALASQAGQVVVARTGGVGSIGVVCMHVDYSAALEQEGIAVTMIHAGKHKVDGNPYAPLPDGVREEMQAEMEQLRGLFAATVAAGRGKRLSAADAIRTEARCLGAEEAVQVGLADAVAEPRAAFRDFVDEITKGARAARKTGDPKMGKGLNPRAAVEDEDQAVDDTEDQVEGEGDQPDETQPGEDETLDDAPASTNPAAATERRRVAAILNAPEAVGQDGLARHLAFNTDLSPAAAVSALKAAVPGAGSGRLASVMRGTNPRVGPASLAAATGPSAADLMREKFTKK